MFRRANDNTEDNDDKHRTRTDVQRELFMPGLADVHAFHAADMRPIYVKKGVGIQNVSIQHRTTHRRRAELSFKVWGIRVG